MKNFETYLNLIHDFKSRDYIFKKFTSKIDNKLNIILRHDVDFDIQYALEMAELEKKNNIFSTYFFLLSSDSYNLISKKNIKNIKSIQNFGHDIGLHYDPQLYQDINKGLSYELNIFEQALDIKIKVISFHRPHKFYLSGKKIIGLNLLHTYEKQFFKKLKYVSDSGGEFKFGHPCNSKEFHNQDSFQLLIHPMWWKLDGSTVTEKLKNLLIINEVKYSEHMCDNLKPWKDYCSNEKT